MATLPFDTHKAVKELQDAGFNEAQAEAVVATVGSGLVGNIATKQDLLELRNELRAEMQAQGNELRSELRSEIQAQGSDLYSKMQAMELRITLRMGALIVGGVALIIALDKLL